MFLLIDTKICLSSTGQVQSRDVHHPHNMITERCTLLKTPQYFLTFPMPPVPPREQTFHQGRSWYPRVPTQPPRNFPSLARGVERNGVESLTGQWNSQLWDRSQPAKPFILLIPVIAGPLHRFEHVAAPLLPLLICNAAPWGVQLSLAG